MWEPSGGDTPTVDRPQPFTMTNFFHTTRRNFFIYADKHFCKDGANIACVFELKFIVTAYQLLFWIAEANRTGDWDFCAIFPTFGNPGNSAYSIERPSGDNSGGRNEATAINVLDEINFILLNVALYPNESL